MATKKSRYAQKKDLGLVPHVYNRDSKAFRAGVPPHAPVAIAPRICVPRKGRHCLIAA